MPWGAVIAAVVCQAGPLNYSGRYTKRELETDLEQMARQHRARVAAETAKTVRDAKIGALLLIGFIVVAIYGCAQLLGLT